MQFGQGAMMAPMQQQSALPAVGQPAQQSQQHESLIPKILPTALLGGLFLKGTGGLNALSQGLSGGGLRSAAGGVAANILQKQAKDMINPQLAQNLSQLGVNDFDKVPEIANVANPAINQNMEAVLAHAPGSVDMTGFAKRASDLIDQDINVSEPVRKKMLNVLNHLPSTPAGVKYFTGDQNRVDALKELRVLDSMKSRAYSSWQSSMRSGRPDEEQHSAYLLLRDVTNGTEKRDELGQPVIDEAGKPVHEFDGLRNRIFSDEKGEPITLDEMTKGQMINQLDPLKSSQPEVYNNMAAKIRGAGSLLEARHLMSDLTQGSIAHDKMSYSSSGGGAHGGDILSNFAHGPLGVPAAVFAGTKSPLDALDAALMQSHGLQVGLTSALSKIARR